MSEQEKKKKIIGLRTFADDVRRVKDQSSNHQTSLSSPVPVKTKKVAPAPVADNTSPETLDATIANVAPEKMPVQKDKQTLQEKETPPSVPENAKAVDETMDIPSFHNLHASSLEDTTFTDTHEIPDKDSQPIKRKEQRQRKIAAHELGINVDEIGNKKSSVLSLTRDSIFDTEEAETSVGEGTIVTDRKREKFRLFPALAKAVSNWVGDKVEEVEESHEQKREIIKSARRKDVITEAAEYSKLAPTDDHSAVTERLKDVKRITKAEELQVKDAAAVPKPTWLYTDDAESKKEKAELPTTENEKETSEAVTSPQKETPKAADVPAEKAATPVVPQQEPVVQEKVVAAQDTTPIEQNAPRTPDTSDIPAEPTSFTEAVPQERPLETTPQSTAAENFVETQKQDTEAADQPEQTEPKEVPSESVEQPTFVRRPVPDYRLNKSGQPVPRQKEGTPYLTFAAVIIGAILLGAATTVWWFSQTPGSTPAAITKAPPLIAVQTEIPVPLSTDRNALYESILTASNQGGSIIITPTVEEVEATTEQVFTTLNLSAPSNFGRNVSRMAFGATSGRDPFIIMEIISFDVAFGGILAWEPSMTSDLAPLFGSAVRTNSYDAKVNNHDIRVLTNDGFNDQIVYGFLNKKTLLITTTREVFMELIPLINQ